VGLISAIIICALLFIFSDFFGAMFTDDRTMIILITLLPAVIFSAIYSAFRGALWGTKNYFSVSWTELAEQVVRVLAFFVVANTIFDSSQGAISAGVAMSIACFFSALFVCIVYFCDRRKLSSPKGYFLPLLRSATPVTGVRTASSLIQPIIAVLFPLMMVLAGHTNEQAMSLYGIAMGMTFPLLFLPSTIIGALSFTLIPELSSNLAKGENNIVRERITSSLTFSVLISCMVIPFFMGAGEGICQFLYQDATSGIYLSRAAWIMIPLGLSNITSSILNTYNLEARSFLHNILGGVFLLVCVICLSGVCGVDCLIYGFGGCMLLTTILNLSLIRKHTGFALNILRPTLYMLIFLLPSTLLCQFTFSLCNSIFTPFFSLTISAILGIGSFLVLCLTFRVFNLSMLVQKFKPRKTSLKVAKK
ncbi:MAG: polysaccharide biosynthesis C-terminal domain-containing protein, partial [Clostridia bacterium]|nr:polysaccharide biosynthesis C-terminal domain-containing protein [Clostridia bacterium]